MPIGGVYPSYPGRCYAARYGDSGGYMDVPS